MLIIVQIYVYKPLITSANHFAKFEIIIEHVGVLYLNTMVHYGTHLNALLDASQMHVSIMLFVIWLFCLPGIR